MLGRTDSAAMERLFSLTTEQERGPGWRAGADWRIDRFRWVLLM